MRSLLLRSITRRFHRLSSSYRQVAHLLLTRLPVAISCIATTMLPLDLHVLGLSLAFILSQDQTLRCIIKFVFYLCSSLMSFYTKSKIDGSLLFLSLFYHSLKDRSSLSASEPSFTMSCFISQKRVQR